MKRLLRWLAICALLVAPVQVSLAAAPAYPLATAVTYHVNSTDDKPDADVGIPACADANGHCTLRAAIQQANFTTGVNTITVPSGVYLLTRAGEDDVASLGDLDVTDDLTIQGAGAGSTIVDGNGARTGDRVFQIHDSAQVTNISDLTIRAGQKISGTFDAGGGLLWEGTDGGVLRLSRLVFESNTAIYGGGLSLSYGDAGLVDLEHIVVHGNRAPTAAGGGMYVDFGSGLGSFVLNNSQIYSNTAFQDGGVYLYGSVALFVSPRIEQTDIYSNSVNGDGGGLGVDGKAGSAAFPLQIFNSRIYNNHAFQGGGVSDSSRIVISQTTVAGNTANRGGGLFVADGFTADVTQSTLSGNSAQSGGGLYVEHFIYNASIVTLTNSTLSGNTAARDGAGLYADSGAIQLFDDTLAANQVAVPNGDPYAGVGGGIFISPTAVITAFSTIIADNTHRYGVSAAVPDDCFGTIHPKLTNLIETTTGCAFAGSTFGNITSHDPLLGPLQFNGGPTQSQALLIGSPALDPADAYCLDAAGSPLTVDQRGFARPHGTHCDIGAFEFYVPGPFLPLIRH